ncbi:MAG: ABC transporter ATP-binding protein [Clostridia bacterium]|nr:ABC transporter ATP-binding protein [Clostridia bacterium]
MKIRNLTKKFASKIIFDNATFEFIDGKITYITGKSGIGKTTLLRIIAGLDKAYTGEILGRSDKISYVFQEPRLFPNLTVSENISVTTDNSPYTVDMVLKLTELEKEKDALPSSLSGGMKMRIALARALYYNGDVFLMDEPFSALDDATKELILPKAFELLKDKTVIIVSHNIEEAKKYADTIIDINSPLNN